MAIKASMTISEVNMILGQLKKSNPEGIIQISSTNRLPFVDQKRDGTYVDTKTGEECAMVEISIGDYTKELTSFLENNKEEMEDQEMELVIQAAKFLSNLRRLADENSFIISKLDRRFFKRRNMVLAQESLDQGRRWLGKIKGFIEDSPYKEAMKPEDVIHLQDAHELTDEFIKEFYSENKLESLSLLRKNIQSHLIETCSIEKMQDKNWIYINTRSAFLSQYMWTCFKHFVDAKMYLGESYSYFK